jgi:GNAT superfamily N-acetyltransferase
MMQRLKPIGMDEIVVRRAKYRDWRELFELACTLFPRELDPPRASWYIRNSFDCTHIATKDNEVVGFYIFEDGATEDGVWLNFIGVSANVRRTNVGSRLLNHFEEQAAADGFARVELDVWDYNDPALRFYERHGYVFQCYLVLRHGTKCRYVKSLQPAAGVAPVSHPMAQFRVRLWRRVVFLVLVDIPKGLGRMLGI